MVMKRNSAAARAASNFLKRGEQTRRNSTEFRDEVRLNRTTLKLCGTCGRCGSRLYDIVIETGTALCSNDKCGRIVRFDAEVVTRQTQRASAASGELNKIR